MAKQKDHQTKGVKKPKQHAAGASKKVFDVAPPGKVPAAANSRSVPPSIKPPVPDDQLVPGAPKLRAHDPNEKHPLLEHRTPAAIAPPEHSEGQHDEIAVQPTPSTPVLTEEKPAAAAPVADNTPEAPAPPVQPAEEVPEQTPPPASQTPAIAEEPTPGQLAVEQMVEADTEAPATQPQSPPAASSNKSIDDLLAESGAPVLDNEPPGGVLVSHHSPRRSWVAAIFIFLIAVIIAAAALNFLLDAEVITTDIDLPHTDLL